MTTYFIDPSAASDGDGSEGSPFNTWASVTWGAGNTYLQKRGTTYQGNITIAGSGSAGSLIRLGAYGSGDRPKVDGTGSNLGSIYMTGRSYIAISDFECYGSSGGSSGAIHVLNSDHVYIDNCYCHDSRQGVRIDNATSGDKSVFRITNCTVEDCNNVGITVVTGTSSGGTLTDVIIRGNSIRSCGHVDETPGLQVTTRIASSAAYDATRVVYDAIVENNLVEDAAGYGVFYKYVTRGRFADNEVTLTCQDNSRDTQTCWFGGCRDLVISGNHIHHNGGWTGGSIGGGVGIFIDQGSTGGGDGHDCQRCKVIGNHIHHQFNGVNSSATPGNGITVFKSTDTQVSGNIIHDCLFAISVRGSGVQNSERTIVANNTCVNIERAAILVANLADETTVKNNVVDGCTVGVFEESGDNAPTNVTREYNCVYGASEYAWAGGAIGTYTAGSPGTGDTEVDPLLESDYTLGDGSPCIGAGVYIAGVKHYGGVTMSVAKPDMGAMRKIPARLVTGSRATSG